MYSDLIYIRPNAGGRCVIQRSHSRVYEDLQDLSRLMRWMIRGKSAFVCDYKFSSVKVSR